MKDTNDRWIKTSIVHDMLYYIAESDRNNNP